MNTLDDPYGSYYSRIHWTIRTGSATREYIKRSIQVVRMVKSVLRLVTIRGIGQPSNSKGDNLYKEKFLSIFQLHVHSILKDRLDLDL